MVRTLIGLALTLLAWSGSAAAQSVGASVEAAETRLDAIDPQRLKPGKCGLFVWSRTAQPVFILFAQERPAEAKVKLAGRDRTLKRKAFAGERVFGAFEKQTFEGAGVRLELELTFERDAPLRDGAVIQGGVLRLTERGGWQSVVPVGGMAACQG